MSRLAEFRKLEQTLAAQLAELEAMKGSSELQKEIEFETKLRSLLEKYGFSLKDIINILDPQAARRAPVAAAPEKATRKAREVKVYKNPHNGEVIETKGGNHKLLKEWKAQYGGDEVEGWLNK
ncbi:MULTISPECIES: histone-like nucleoid-structuring protein, MvaT/MvaU family [Pseudomonas]|uniref:Cupin superfamily acireductone dioxygenase involved in methionine salvage n=1 Tax=Pseudomonas hunanensis TaxID=1247546 RepID=A0ACC6JZ54_9PSED|nr:MULTISPECIES: histone-like nucleoid-structuring protein, MvaT/MvaU family [Pseudomonas]MBP2262182.1 cupin superfamily acireductone dioxygenase involved in methionine salvage [Pseudomonas sp. BP8]MDR6711392.1 cupin superfamily acireductone dioxygenase involved in methionine salvage [Pseudomonas hunanensis]HDS1733108.1 DNA binding protein [Pseudomonas putida]